LGAIKSFLVAWHYVRPRQSDYPQHSLPEARIVSFCFHFLKNISFSDIKKDHKFFIGDLKMKSLIRMLGISVCLPLVLLAESVVIEDSQGELYSVEIQSDDSFLNLIDYISSISQAPEIENFEEIRTFRIMISKNAIPLEQLRKTLITRKYEAGVSDKQSADIATILKTLADSSLYHIRNSESYLNRVGDRIKQVHPFHFLSCIFTNEELKVCIHNLQGRSWVWKGFLNGITSSLDEENGRDNLLKYTSDFAAKIKIDPNVILPILKAKNWERFIDTLIDIVPRNGCTDRYNM
jgi:hypothetical protein